MVNSLELVKSVGQSFKANEVIAKDPKYFIGDKSDALFYTTGKLTKVAITSADFTYEDSSVVTESMSEALSSKFTMRKAISLGTNANIEHLVKKGDKIKTGESLVIFENSFEDDNLNDILDKMGDEMNEAISDMSKNKLVSKYTGVIADVILYYNKPIEEFSESIQKILKKFIKENKARMANINKINPINNVRAMPVEKQTSGKLKGEEVDGLLIEIFIEYDDNLSVGDKITFYTALKSIISNVIPSGEEPFTEYKPDEEIEAIISPLSIVSRMTTDVFNAMYLNKLLVGLKDKIAEKL